MSLTGNIWSHLKKANIKGKLKNIYLSNHIGYMNRRVESVLPCAAAPPGFRYSREEQHSAVNMKLCDRPI